MAKSKTTPQSLTDCVDGAKNGIHDLHQRIRDFQKRTGGQTFDYQQLRRQYEDLANQDVQQAQSASCNRRVARLIEQADMNPRWVFDALDDSDPLLADAIGTAKAFVNGFAHWEKEGGRGLYIYGGYGTGKSTIAGAIAHDLIRIHQRSVIFQQWASVIDRLFFGVSVEPRNRHVYRQALERVDLLVLDEVAVNRSQLNESQSSYLGHLLRRRHNLSKSVILISNHTPEDFQKAVGDFCFEAFKSFMVVDVRLRGASRRPLMSGHVG